MDAPPLTHTHTHCPHLGEYIIDVYYNCNRGTTMPDLSLPPHGVYQSPSSEEEDEEEEKDVIDMAHRKQAPSGCQHRRE